MSLLKASQSRIISRAVVLIIAAVFISGCASKKKKDILSQQEQIELLQEKVEEFYAKGKKQLSKGNYEQAVQSFIVLQRIFPFGDVTEQSKLETIFALDKLGEREAAVTVSYTHLRAHETRGNLVCRLLLEKKK